MNKREFEFYISSPLKPMAVMGWTITDKGETIRTSSSIDWIIGLSPISGENLYFDHFFDESSTAAVFFYDANTDMLGSIFLKNYNLSLIKIPHTASYYAVRFSPTDEVTTKLKNKSLVYTGYSIKPYYKKLEKRLAKEAGQELYRTTLQGDIKLVGSDFNKVWQSPLDTQFVIFIVDISQGVRKDYYKGSFSKIDCKFDYEKKVCSPKIEAFDEYFAVLNKYTDTYDLIKLGVTPEPITFDKKPFMQIYCKGSDSVTNIFGGNAWPEDVSAVDDETLITNVGFTRLQIFREIYVEGAKPNAANGIYTRYEYSQEGAGTQNFTEVHTWYRDLSNGDFYSISQRIFRNTGVANIYLRDRSGAVLYSAELKSQDSHTFGLEGSLTNVVLKRDAEDYRFATIVRDISYWIYARIIHDDPSKGSPIGPSDFASSNLAYKRRSSIAANSNDYASLIQQSIDSTPKYTKYGVNDYNEYFTNQYLPDPSGFYIPICRGDWINSSLWLDYDNAVFDIVQNSYKKTEIMRDGFSIANVIKVLLAKIDSSLTHEATPEYSQFLYGEAMPLDEIDRFFVYITPKSNMILGSYDQAAQKAEVTLEKILNMLRNCFRCYWYIENGKLRIEHVSYFMNGLTYKNVNSYFMDITQLFDAHNKKNIALGQGEIGYDKEELTRRYEFTGEGSAAFASIILETDEPYMASSKLEQIDAADFYADIEYMQINAKSVSKDGFALLCPEATEKGLRLNDLKIELKEDSVKKEISTMNGLASWAYLVNFYRYDMPSIQMQSDELWHFGPIRLKECVTQTIRIPFKNNLQPYSKVKTAFGEGRIIGISENIDTGLLDLSIVYPLK